MKYRTGANDRFRANWPATLTVREWPKADMPELQQPTQLGRRASSNADVQRIKLRRDQARVPGQRCASHNARSLNDFVRTQEHRLWNRHVEGLRGLEVNDELVLGRQLHR